MRYSSIISIVALGLASFSVAAPVGSNLPDGKGDGGPSDSATGPLGSVKDLPNSLISGLTGDGMAGVGGLIGGGSLGSASSPKRDIESSPETQEQPGSEKPKGGLLGLGVLGLKRREETPAKAPADGNPVKGLLGKDGGVIPGGVIPGGVIPGGQA